jgi:Arc/MetJ-type ribon-helix-helix transcriptional regulator
MGEHKMGLKNLSRPSRMNENAPEMSVEAAAQAFIADAPVGANPEPKRRRKKTSSTFVRTTFSLSKDVNRQIDKISLTPRNFRATRSDVIRAGIVALQNLDKAELLELLERASRAEPIEELTQEE